MEDFNTELSKKTLVQQIQFEQWVRTFFQLTYKLYEVFDPMLQDLHYIKLYGILTEGHEYAKVVLQHLEGGKNVNKTNWYLKFVSGIASLKSLLSERELLYIEYRRHNICHIFQNQYEHIQENYSIKSQRKGMGLTEIDAALKSLLLEFGNDRNIDGYLKDKLKMTLTCLYDELVHLGKL